jgi:hypothetical protein
MTTTNTLAAPKPRKKPEDVTRKRWIFRLSLVLVLLPLFYLPGYFDSIEMNRGAKGLGERVVGEYVVAHGRSALPNGISFLPCSMAMPAT